MADKAVLFEKKDGTAWITMNRPKTLNSLSEEMCDALCAAFAECERDGSIRAAVLCGTGKAFCAGGDIDTLKSLKDFESARAYVHKAGSITAAIIASKKPYIAAVGGAAAGAGFNIALACDFICASTSARFLQAFTSIGLISDCGGNCLLPIAVGPRMAKKLMMLPERLTAEKALSIGMIDSICDDETLLDEAASLAARLVRQPPLALSECKRLVNVPQDDFEELLLKEEDIQARLIIGDDCKEGLAAFAEKRPPLFMGRS